jgi:hypothetical protein
MSYFEDDEGEPCTVHYLGEEHEATMYGQSVNGTTHVSCPDLPAGQYSGEEMTVGPPTLGDQRRRRR